MPNIRPKKKFGQNFIVDHDVLSRVIEAMTAVGIGNFVEVGPGTGVITAKLLESADHLTAVEFDRDLIPFLQRSFTDRPNFHLVHGDILRWQPGAELSSYQVIRLSNERLKISQFPLLEKDSAQLPLNTKYPIPNTLYVPYHLVGNIPYNLTTKLFEVLLSWEHKPAAITFLMQREVAEKIVQKDGKNSPLAIAAQMLGEARLLFDIPPVAFHPRPRVMTSVVQLTANSDPAFTSFRTGRQRTAISDQQKNKKQKIKDETAPLRLRYTNEESWNVPQSGYQQSLQEASDKGGRGDFSGRDPLALYDFAHKLFRNPRKTLLNNLLSLMPREQALELLQKNNLDPMVRPERLSTDVVLKLFQDHVGAMVK